MNSYNCSFKIELDSEESIKKWVTAFNEKSKETMVYETCRSGKGKKVVKIFYLRCHHKQRQSGMHTKSNKKLKTTHKIHNNKHTNCPAQLMLTLLPPATKLNGFCVSVPLKHNHNHLVQVADALRFRPLSEQSKKDYYDLFSHGHSPATAHLEYETNLMYSDKPDLIADRNCNPKVSDVYNLFNKWRKCNIGVRTGKYLFAELEKCVAVYNEEYNDIGGKAFIQRYSDCNGKEEPLILAVCTPLMSRVHRHILQSKELVFIDASSSFEDFNNPMFVVSTSSAAGGLPLGIVVTSAESATVIHQGMTKLSQMFPEDAFYGSGSPKKIIIDDSMAERDGLRKTWHTADILLCTFHFLQNIWRWLLNVKHGIDCDERQILMNLVRKLVYAKTEAELITEYSHFENHPFVKNYKNFNSYIANYWVRRKEWALCFRDAVYMRGINTNNYAESGIRILKDIVFKRVKAYNLIQLFKFITITFDMYYKRRLLAIAYNRMDRYIALRYKGLGALEVNNIKESTTKSIYLVKSTHYKDRVYEINTTVWTCTCSISLTGYPSGEPCKHQHAVANKFNLVAPNLIPYFNGDGRFLYALVALGVEQVGDKSFYMGMNEEFHRQSEDNITHNDEDDNTTNVDDNSADENLSFALNYIDEGEALQEDVGSLCRKFIEDV